MPTFALSSHDDDIFLLKVLPAVPAARLALLFVSIKMPSTSGADGIFFGLFVFLNWPFRFPAINAFGKNAQCLQNFLQCLRKILQALQIFRHRQGESCAWLQ